jgi:glycosyltransferase involved in cell wall biosynthesis
MKILHVIPSISPSLGGPPQVALNLVWALRESGVEAEIITTNYDGSSSMNFPLNQRVDYPFKAHEEVTVPVWFLPFQPPALKEFIFSPALTRWMWQHIQNYDVLDNHYLFSYAPTCAAAIARLKKIPYTIRTMGQLTPWALAQSQLKKQIYTTLVERTNLNHAAAIHCTSIAEAEDVRNFGITTPTVTLPLGVHSSTACPDARSRLRAQYNISSEVPIVLFLSRLHYKKRPDLLLQSLSQLKEQGQRFHLIMAGSGDPDYEMELKSLAASLNITDRVSFPGLVLEEAKDLLLQGANLFVLPSFSENFGIAVAEALSAGLPVVITPDIQISSDIMAANAGLVVQGEVEALTNAIAQLLNSPQLRDQLGKNGQRLAKQHYSWITIAKQLIPIYERIAARKPLPSEMRFNQLEFSEELV